MEVIVFILISIFVLLTGFSIVLDLPKFIAARVAKVRIGFDEYILFRLNRLNYKRLVDAMIMSNTSKLDLDKKILIELEKRNLNSLNIVTILIMAKKAEIDFPFMTTVKADAEGIDFKKELKKSADVKDAISRLKDRFNK